MIRAFSSLFWLASVGFVSLSAGRRAVADDGCPTCNYHPQCATFYYTQPTTAYRVEYETIYEEAKIVRYRPVWEKTTQQRRYFVARPVTQTVERQEKYSVLRPVWGTEIRDLSYNKVRNVVETHQRQEPYTVSRQVWETQTQPRTQTVRRYVTQTVERDVSQVSYQPVTTYVTKYEDRGQYTTQQQQVERGRGFHLRWAPAGWGPDPATGKLRYDPPGLAWIPKNVETRTVSRRVWQPNRVAVQVPRTSYQRVVTTTKVPTQVGRWVNDQVVQNVPVRVQKTITETQIRTVPYTTTRQVVERVERKVPIRVCKWVADEQVRTVPVTCTRMMYEEHVDEVPVCVCKMVATEETVRVPRLVQKLVPVTCECCVPHTVVMQIPCSGCDACECAGATVAGDVEDGASPSPVVMIAPPSAREPAVADQSRSNPPNTRVATVPLDERDWRAADRSKARR